MKPFACCLLFPLLLAACTDAPTTPQVPGARVYTTNCMTCHQENAQGIEGIYPPLAGTEWVNGDDGRLIRLVLNGMHGPITVDGVEYNNVMTAHRFLSDDQIADVLTYVRANFGNDADSVRAEDVAAVRAALDRRDPWTAEELESQTGIPGR